MPIPKYRHNKTSNRAVVTIAGRDYWLGPYDNPESHAKYAALIAEWESSGRSTSFRQGKSAITCAMVFADYLQYCQQTFGVKGRGTEAARNAYALKFAAIYLDIPAAEFGPVKFRVVISAILSHRMNNGKPLSRKYATELISRIRGVFKWAVSRELVDVSVYQALCTVEQLRAGRSVARETDPVKPVDELILKRTLEHLSRTIQDMVNLQLTTGMRPSELCNLTPAMIDRSGKVWTANLREHKTAHKGKSRTIHFGPRAQKIISRYLGRDESKPLFSPAEAELDRRAKATAARKTDPRWGCKVGDNRLKNPKRSAGDSYTQSSYRKAVQRACLTAFPIPIDATKEQIEKHKETYFWSPNQLRHSMATTARDKFGIEAASVLLGHSKINTTEIYAEKSSRLAKQVAEKIG